MEVNLDNRLKMFYSGLGDFLAVSPHNDPRRQFALAGEDRQSLSHFHPHHRSVCIHLTVFALDGTDPVHIGD